ARRPGAARARPGRRGAARLSAGHAPCEARRPTGLSARAGRGRREGKDAMRYDALACDYDGTLAFDGTVAPETIDALERLGRSGRALLMVSGRELDDLQRVCQRLDLFDRVVVEHGALLYRPATAEAVSLAPPPDPRL